MTVTSYTTSQECFNAAGGIGTVGLYTEPLTSTVIDNLRKGAYSKMYPYTLGATDVNDVGWTVEFRIVKDACAEILTASKEKRGAKYDLTPTETEIEDLKSAFGTPGVSGAFLVFTPGENA